MSLLPIPPGAKPSCEQIIDILPDAFVVIDRDYRIVAANAAYCRRYKVQASDVVGRFCYEVSHRVTKPCAQYGEHCPQQHVFEKGESIQVMHIHYDRQNRPEYVQLQAAPLRDAAGNVLYMGEFIYPTAGPRDSEALLVGRSPPMLRLTSLLQRVAPTLTTVLLLGESGSGKECVANYLHQYSNRTGGPFVIVDCGTLGEQLIESELFGYEKGSFTGAQARKKGLIEAAHGGTLFIDEIGDLPLSLQTKLLRVLETGSFRRIGGTEYLQVDVRVIAATHRDLQAMVGTGRFRQDLYYRISPFPVRIPPLRDRKDDIPSLVEHFLSRMEDGERHLPLSPDVIEQLLAYDYPGNVRELRHIVERAAILACDEDLRPEHLVFEGLESDSAAIAQPVLPMADATLLDRRGGRLDESRVMDALRRCGGRRAEAARVLGVSERTLYRHLRKLRGAEIET